jgi:hypothetical protein
MSIKKLTCASYIGLASVFALVAQGQNTVVTNNWNVTPWNVTGPTLETFQVLPGWATGQVVDNVTGWTNRDDRFWGQTAGYQAGNHLVFSTPIGVTLTNTISGAIIKQGLPIFIDMRCKMNPFDTTPPAIEANTILCFYANETSNLVVASSSQCITNETKINPTLYYPIMIRFATDKFDVFFNTTNAPTVSLLPTTNVISKMVISGDGEMDDLYISYGDPLRTTTNSAAIVTGLSATNAEEQVIINWLANKGVAGSYAKSNAEKFYLTNTSPTNTTDTTFTGALGIGSFSYNPSTSNVTVVVTLTTDASSKKTGKINGKLQLKGAGDYNAAKSGGWSSSLGDTAILTNDFVNGSATYTFKLIGDANTNKFFLPIIVSQ